MTGIIATIDFEMTALDYAADMIEAGLALWEPGEPIRTWSSLVRPRPDCLWSEESVDIHRIPRQDLEHAPGSRAVAARINELFAGTDIAYCDGLPHDQVWMRGLFWQADLKPLFRLAHIWSLPGLETPAHVVRMMHWLDATVPRHRAGPDATNLMRAYAHALGHEPEEVALP